MSTNTDQQEQGERPEDPLAVKGEPTKGFFVYTLTKDIQLDRAIADLVDNCVDGAKRLRDGLAEVPGPTQSTDRYNGLFVRITVNKDQFCIEDNCGGIPIDVARRYAFKFGRDAGFIETANSVGQFGVGMKRALLKFGSKFLVQTHHGAEKYEIEVDVNKWLEQSGWDFRITRLENDDSPASPRGTKIVASNLYPAVSQTFSQNYFSEVMLRNRIRTAQQHFLRNGLTIQLNDVSIVSDDWQLKIGSGIEPHYERYDEDADSDAPIRVRIYAGLGESTHARAGWYVFCNGRCILEADQSLTTGWGEVAGADGVSVPRYHGQFSRFRGFVYLDCAKAEKLPWNSTKTDLDLESPVYRNLRTRLVKALRPIIDFLNALDSEKDLEPPDQLLSHAISSAATQALSSIPERKTFAFNANAVSKKGPPLINVAFKKTRKEVDELAVKLKTSSARDTGIAAFDFAYQRLVVEDDL